jgi:YHS domain-containing protein
MCLPVGLLLLFSFAVAAADKSKAEVKPLCPVTGKSIDKSLSIDYKSGKLYFSGAEALKKFQDSEEKYATKANLQLVVTGQAHQKACPLMGKAVVSGRSVMVAGVKVELCCNICKTKVTKAKPEEQLEMIFGTGCEKGYTVNKT